MDDLLQKNRKKRKDCAKADCVNLGRQSPTCKVDDDMGHGAAHSWVSFFDAMRVFFHVL